MHAEPTITTATFVLVLACAGCLGGCSSASSKAEVSLDDEVFVSIRVVGDASTVELALDLQRLFGVSAHAWDAIDTGVRTLKILGAYARVLDSLRWIVRQGLEILANDERTREIIQVALFSALKSA